MGLFDTIHLETHLVCPGCGIHVKEAQTHAFEDTMSTYRIGSVVRGGVLTGIVKETFWCSPCHKAGREGSHPVHLVIWHSVLVGVEQELAAAEARLAAVDRLDLIGWLDDAQRREERWRRRFHGLLSDVRRWHEHVEEQKNPKPIPEGQSPEKTERLAALRKLWGLPEEILSAEDPLAALLEKHEVKNDGDDFGDGWW